MKVFKFGGASLKSPERIRNVVDIIKKNNEVPLLIVLSAMGSTTDTLERIIQKAHEKKDYKKELDQVVTFHKGMAKTLLPEGETIDKELSQVIDTLKTIAEKEGEFDQAYDQLIGWGEILSSVIVNKLLRSVGESPHWIDSRDFIKTDKNFREGKVDWTITENLIQELLPILKTKTIIAQGFIGATLDGQTTTLGREGSDYSAAIFGYSLRAQSVTIWKDVPGIMSADPKKLPEAIIFEELPYQEAAEMTYFGASVIHPKTIKPLANRNIPLLVKSFIDPTLPGTIIHQCQIDKLPPLIVYKEDQCLISCKVTDYTFIEEAQLGLIFKALSECNVRINVMQNSAITFSFCVDYRESNVLKLIALLGKNFEVYYNTNLSLITIKNYDTKTFSEYRNLKGVVMEQSSRSTLQVLVKN